ncbi:MAG: phosphoglycerate kinase, partial [Candidatus Acidiferrales bacterium]
MKKLSIKDLELSGKRVFIRADFNVPLANRKVEDDTRIRATLPTLKLAIDRGARLVIASHLGRPKGKPESKYSLAPIAERLKELLGKPVIFASDCIGTEPESRSKALKNGHVLLLENVRFHAEEEQNDEGFSRQLAALCDGIYVDDAFGSAHRTHASVVGITKFVRQAAAGLLMEQELEYLGKALTNPERPFLAILGGAKASEKIDVIQNLIKIADTLLIGGAMAYTFFRAKGFTTGKSLVEEDKVELALTLLGEAVERGCRIVLPVDHVLARSTEEGAQTQLTGVEGTPADWMGLDIGPKTIELFRKEIAAARTIVWNGPLGMFEKPAFARGTMEVAQAVADATANGATS